MFKEGNIAVLCPPFLFTYLKTNWGTPRDKATPSASGKTETRNNFQKGTIRVAIILLSEKLPVKIWM